MLPTTRFRCAAGVTFVFAIVLSVSSAQAQCRSSSGHRYLPPVSAVRVITQPAITPAKTSTVTRAAVPTQAQTNNEQNRISRPAPESDQQANALLADLPVLKPEQIRTVNNGARMRIEVPTEQWKQGMGILAVQGTTMLIRPERWEENSVTLQLPQFLLDKPVAAQLFIAANPETLLEKVEFQLIPGK